MGRGTDNNGWDERGVESAYHTLRAIASKLRSRLPPDFTLEATEITHEALVEVLRGDLDLNDPDDRERLIGRCALNLRWTKLFVITSGAGALRNAEGLAWARAIKDRSPSEPGAKPRLGRFPRRFHSSNGTAMICRCSTSGKC